MASIESLASLPATEGANPDGIGTTLTGLEPPRFSILDALSDPHLFGGLPTFRDLTSWRAWLVFLRAVYGLPIEGEDLETFKRHTGRTKYDPPPGGFPEFVSIVGRQSGKALEVSTPIRTTAGWKTMGTLEVGDFVFGPDGLPTRVVAATPVMHWRPCFDLEFSGGETIRADVEHEWLVVDRQYRKNMARRREPRTRRGAWKRLPLAPRVVTTAEIAESWQCPPCRRGDGRTLAESNYSVVMPRALEFPARGLPIDPYVLGVWLGDGVSRNASITIGGPVGHWEASPDIEIIERIRACGHATHVASRRGLHRIEGLSGGLRATGQFREKHIPAEYLSASIGQRLALLRGLMDTDGYCSVEGNLEFSSTSRVLIDGFLDLVRSLGWEATFDEGRATLYGKDCGPKFRVRFCPDVAPFTLTRKLERWRPSERANRYRFIRSVRPAPASSVRCIQVERDDGMFLAGRTLVPTHNSKVAALIATFEAMLAPREADGTKLYALLVAQDHRASVAALFSYVEAPFDVVPLLRRSVVDQKAGALRLRSGVTVAAYPCRPAAVRGLRARVALVDELAFFIATDGRRTDVEMLRALRPALATTGGKLGILSSPYGQTGALWEIHRQHYGRDDSTTLVWQASAQEMNPTLPADYLEKMRQDDPEAYRSEVLGEFRAGVSTFFEPAALDACVIADRRELPVAAGVRYRAFTDPSGGSSDAFGLAIGHEEKGKAVVDCVRAWGAPFNPSGVVEEAAALLKAYRVSSVTGDKYAGEWPREQFRARGISYNVASLDRSKLYLEMLPRVNATQIEIPDDEKLLRELRGLERRRGTAGKDRIDHRPGEHDDRANCVAGLCVEILGRHGGDRLKHVH